MIGQTTLLDPMSVLYNDAFILPQAPTRFGFVFDGWYVDESLTTPFTLDIMPANSFTIYAKYMGT